MEFSKVKGIIESILFAAGREVKISELMSALELSSDKIIEAVSSLKEDYQKDDRGLEIINVEDAYQLCTKKAYYEYIYSVFDKRSKPNLSQAALETLAIIAYNQPITRLGVEDIRGVGCDAMIRKLAAKALIKEVGREDTPGKPILYGVTDEFMDAFSLTSLDELPELKEMKEDFDQEDIFNTKYTEE